MARGEGKITENELSSSVIQELDSKREVVIIEVSPSPSERKKGAFYFIVSDKNEIPAGNVENIKVSPMMGVKKI